jgi:GT2 family glycosyltransferase
MISLLVINYRSARLAADAIRTARSSTSQQLEAVVVDNSCDAAEAESLRKVADTVVVAPENLGYAGGINLGRRSCRGDILIVANPDVEFGLRAIDELARQIDRGAAVAGPALFWDDDYSWRLPPADLYTGIQKLDEAIASRFVAWARWRDRRRIQSRLHFWSLILPENVPAISGAVMAIRASVFDSLKGFDERFALYFEENDFLRRVAARGGSIHYVPAARCRHIYNQSAGQDAARSAERFAESERRYLEKWNGRLVARVLKKLEEGRPDQPAERIDGRIEVPRGDFVVEASPLSTFTTAAGYFPTSRSVDVPAEAWSTYRADRLYLRLVDRASARVLSTFVRYRS